MKIAPWKNRKAIAEVVASGRVVATCEANVMASNQRSGGAQATVEALVWDGEHWLLAHLPKFDFGREPLRSPHHVGWEALPPAEALHWATRIASRVDLDGDREGWTREAISEMMANIDPKCQPPQWEKVLIICPECGSEKSIIHPFGFSNQMVHLETCSRYAGNIVPDGHTVGQHWVRIKK